MLSFYHCHIRSQHIIPAEEAMQINPGSFWKESKVKSLPESVLIKIVSTGAIKWMFFFLLDLFFLIMIRYNWLVFMLIVI